MTTAKWSADDIREAVRAAYGARASQVAAAQAASCCGEGTAPDLRAQLYGAETGDLPETVVSYGCGNPTAIAGLRPGEVVLDLGSGAGLDCFLAARQVGPTGRVIGLDMTDEMLALAEQNRAKLGLTNVKFKKGVMEAIPLPDGAVDVIISNCVINLSPDKDAVFRDAFRVLRPGGRLHVSDVVLLRPLSPAEQEDLNLWAGCVSGALAQEDYATRLRAAGFVDVTVQLQEARAEEAERPWRSALITARRPGGVETDTPWPEATEHIELMAPPGLATTACCPSEAGSSCC